MVLTTLLRRALGQLREGFRTPARRPYPYAPTAGVRKAPMDEIARGGATTVRRALRGFDRDADADEDGGTSSDAVAVLEPAGAVHNPSLLAQILSKLGESNSGGT